MNKPVTTPVMIVTMKVSNNLTTDDAQQVNDLTFVIINEYLLYVFRALNWCILSGVVNVLGVISNSINIAVFLKTGFKDTVTLSLFAMAITDFGACFSSIISTVLINPWFQKLDMPFVQDEVAYILSGWPHVAFAKITTLITAFITAERCLCVTMPLKIKTIVTHRRVVGFLVSFYLLIIASMIPFFYSNRLAWKFDPVRNKTVFGLVFAAQRDTITRILNVFLSVFGFVFIIGSTILLVIKLKQNAKWRLQATTSGKSKASEMETKEQRISKMVVMISTLFIICFFPTTAFQLLKWVDRRMSIDGQFANLDEVLASAVFILESVNSALNVFIYYGNSSNYKLVFDQMFRSKRNKKQ